MEFAELKGRLSVMAELAAQQSSEQARTLNERIDTLARHLSQTLDTNAARLGDNLSEAGRRTSESLSTLNERLVLIDEAKRSLAELSTEVGSLHGVLANKQARGAFGQVRMETIVRDALPAGAYEFQPTLSNGKRPDCVIRLPNAQAPLVIDSKFPLEGFEALRVAQTADETKVACAAVREAVGRHVAAIADKYLIPGETQETALMFVPSESICADLFEKFPDLVQGAHRARVMIVAPNTLMLAVQTVQALLKDAKMRDHAGRHPARGGAAARRRGAARRARRRAGTAFRAVGQVAGEGVGLDEQDSRPSPAADLPRPRCDGGDRRQRCRAA